MDSVKLSDLPKDMLIQLIATIQDKKQKELDECKAVLYRYEQECGSLVKCKVCYVLRLRKESYKCHNNKCDSWICKYHYNNQNSFWCNACQDKFAK